MEEITWYEITKDIIIPVLGILVTLILGIIISSAFNKRAEKVKTKQILIDTYIEFLNKGAEDRQYDQLITSLEVYMDMMVKINLYKYKEKHIPIIRKKISDLQNKIEKYSATQLNHPAFTYKFRFLLGSKKYTQELQPFEEEIVKSESNEYCKQFLLNLTKKIRSNNDIMDTINKPETNLFEYGLEKMETFISTECSIKHNKFFKEYQKKIADMINEY